MEKLEGCYLLVGQDSWSKNKFIAEIKQQVLVAGNEMMNYLEAKDREVMVATLKEFSETLPFFAEQKLIYIKDTGFFKTGKKEETEKFEELIKSLPDYIVLIIDETEVDKRGKLYKTIKAKHQVKEFEYPGEDIVYGMLEKDCKARQIPVETQVIRYFLRNMPENIDYIMIEWHKLMGYINGDKITKEAIDAVCVFSLEKRVFELVKKIAHHQADEALQIYQRMIQGKESPIGVLVLIGRQYRMMLQVKYLVMNNRSPKEIGAALKIPFFAVKEMIDQVKLYKFKQLEEIIETCLETDKDIKTGKMESSKRVEVLIMECLNK